MSTDPKKRLVEARRAMYRTAIVDAAERVFAEHGYEAARVAAIAKASGVSVQTLYGVFPKKFDVFRAVQADRLAQLMQEVGTAVIKAPDPFSRLRCGLEGYLRFHMARPDFLRMQLQERIPWGTTDQQRTPEQTRAWQAGLAMMVGAFKDGIAEGTFVPTDPEVAARTCTAMSQVHLAVWIDRGMPRTADDVATEAMQQIIRTFVDPARAPVLIDSLAS